LPQIEFIQDNLGFFTLVVGAQQGRLRWVLTSATDVAGHLDGFRGQASQVRPTTEGILVTPKQQLLDEGEHIHFKNNDSFFNVV